LIRVTLLTVIFAYNAACACRSVDFWGESPYSVTINNGSFTDAWTDSVWIPTASAAKKWWSNKYTANYAGAMATFTLRSVEHPDYEWELHPADQPSAQSVSHLVVTDSAGVLAVVICSAAIAAGPVAAAVNLEPESSVQLQWIQQGALYMVQTML
jgi:hypothetical protein